MSPSDVSREGSTGLFVISALVHLGVLFASTFCHPVISVNQSNGFILPAHGFLYGFGDWEDGRA